MHTGFNNTTIPWERSALSFPRRLAYTLRAVLLHPLQTFRGVGSGDIAPALGFAALMSLPGVAIDLVQTFVENGKLDLDFALSSLMHSITVTVLGSFIASGLIHLLFRMFGRAGNYSHLLRAICYAQASAVLTALLEPSGQVYLAVVAAAVGVLYQGLAAFAVGRSTYFLSTAKTIFALALIGPVFAGVILAITWLPAPRFEVQPPAPGGAVR